MENKNSIFIKDLASGKEFSSLKDFYKYKGIGEDKGTKYSVLFDRVISKAEKKVPYFEIKASEIFKFFEKKEERKYYLSDSIRNSKFFSSNFPYEFSRVLKSTKLLENYEIDFSKEKDFISDNLKGKRKGRDFISFKLKEVKK